jgi:sarcosine oxidase
MTDRPGEPDVAVIGAGIVGLSTAYALTEEGASVAVYERSVPGNGQSGGESRIFRHSHDDRRLVAMAREARGVWREWEERFGRELLSRDGVVAIGPAVQRRLAVLQDVGGIRAGAIGGAELATLLPLLGPWDGPAMFDEDAGVIRARAAIEALIDVVSGRLVAEEVLSLRVTRTGGSRSEPAARPSSTSAWCCARDGERLPWRGVRVSRCRSARPRTFA